MTFSNARDFFKMCMSVHNETGYDGGRWLLWLHARWRLRRSGFVPYLVVALQNEIFK